MRDLHRHLLVSKPGARHCGVQRPIGHQDRAPDSNERNELEMAAVIPGYRRVEEHTMRERGAAGAVGCSRMRGEKALAWAKVVNDETLSPGNRFFYPVL